MRRVLSSASRAIRRVRHASIAFGGLLRAEVLGGLRLLMGLLACAFAALLLGRFILRMDVAPGGHAHVNVLLALGFLVLIPVLAAAFEFGRGGGATRLRQAAPVSKLTVFGAKLVGSVMLAAIGLALIAGLDIALAAAAPAPNPGGLASGLDWRGLTGMILGLGTLALFGTLCTAIVSRHAFGACAVGGMLAGAPVAFSLAKEHTVFSDVLLDAMASLTLGSGNLGIAAAVVLTILAVLFPLRGLAARNMFLRGGLIGAGTVGLVAVPLGLQMIQSLMLPHATFGIHGAWVNDIDVSPDRSKIALQLYHWENASQHSSLWTVDAETFEVTALPHPVSGILSLLPVDVTGAHWTNDGSRVCGVVFPSSKHFGIDHVSHAVSEVSWDEFNAKVNQGGWTFQRNLPNGGGVTRDCRAWHPEHATLTVRSLGSPKVAKRATHLFYFRGEDGYAYRADGRTGEVTRTGLLFGNRAHGFNVSPDGEWLLAYRGGGRRELHHVHSGRSRNVEGTSFVLTERELPLMLEARKGGERKWFAVGLDDTVPFAPECGSCYLTELDGERWIASVSRRNLYILGSDGQILHTLRETPPPEPRR